METEEKLQILAEAARYDVSCSSSGSSRPNKPGGLGNAAIGGICHAWADDGRCISLLKVLYTNQCVYDCAYCVNRRSNDIPRARFQVKELVDLTMGFYLRNYIEGLFLSSGVVKSPNYTMEQLLQIIRILREEKNFNGYIHLKVIPGCDQDLINLAGMYADRLSVNLELPSRFSLERLAPDKKAAAIFGPMAQVAQVRKLALAEKRLPFIAKNSGAFLSSLPMPPNSDKKGGLTFLDSSEQKALASTESTFSFPSALKKPGAAFVPAGQSTQMIIGASPDSDKQILNLTQDLYRQYDLKRVYFSAYMSLNQDERLPQLNRPPLLREHRLYQADWLLRFYKFSADEILDGSQNFLAEDVDPKTAWALRHPECFPVCIQNADLEEIMRIPGIGHISAQKIVNSRRYQRLRFEDLKSLGISTKKAQYFLTCADSRPRSINYDTEAFRRKLWDPVWKSLSLKQLELFE